MMHKKHLLALIGKTLNSNICRDHLVSSRVATYATVLAYAVHSLCSAHPAAGYAGFFLSAGLGPLSLRVLCQMALRQHLIGCCNTIRQELTHRQEAIVKSHTGLTLWYLGSLV